tara:strand:- start:1538 stop:1711 length:174 start_codon:yes stop_codon:yes gene_type:complete
VANLLSNAQMAHGGLKSRRLNASVHALSLHLPDFTMPFDLLVLHFFDWHLEVFIKVA